MTRATRFKVRRAGAAVESVVLPALAGALVLGVCWGVVQFWAVLP